MNIPIRDPDFHAAFGERQLYKTEDSVCSACRVFITRRCSDSETRMPFTPTEMALFKAQSSAKMKRILAEKKESDLAKKGTSRAFICNSLGNDVVESMDVEIVQCSPTNTNDERMFNLYHHRFIPSDWALSTSAFA
jgi:hypothetical protein